MAQKGLLETQPGKSLLQSFESRVNQELNRAREAAGKIAADALDETNNIIAMV
jgi:DNA-directed RNA polymerase II subunit RPB1